MKNLKRILSLSLVMIFCLGLVTFASAKTYTSYTSFPDSSKVTYKEAMDVLVAIGVIDGKDGNLAPKDNVTREEAAKMVAYICLGKTAADALSKASSSFSDVEAGRWSAGYIAYDVSRNIVNGIGDNKFDPTGNVTGYQFVKMLLAAVGYNSNGEFTGSDWTIAVSSLGYDLDVFGETNATSFDNAATREEAMLYAFNVLTTVMTVKYSSAFDLYYSGTSPLTTIAEDNEYEYTLGYTKYSLEKTDTGDDAFMRPCYTWEIDGIQISQECYVEEDKLYDGVAASTGAIYTVLGNEYSTANTYYYVDGVLQSHGVDGTSYEIEKGNTAQYAGGNGAKTYIYVDPEDVTGTVRICVVNTYLAQVTAVDDDTVTMSVYGATVDDSDFDTDTASDYEVDDYVTVTCADNAIQSIAGTVTTVTGTISSTSSSSLYITGVTKAYSKSNTYKFNGALHDAEEISSALYGTVKSSNFDNTYTFLIDSYGYVIGNVLYEENEANLSYVYISDVDVDADTLVSPTMKIAAEYLDGTSDVLNVLVKKISGVYSWYNPATSAYVKITNASTIAAGFYTYTTDSDGYVTIRAIDTDYARVTKTIDVDSDSQKITVDTNTYYITSATKLYSIDTDGNVTTITGYDNISDSSSYSGAILLTFKDGEKNLTSIYVLNSTYSATGDYYYYSGISSQDSSGWWYTFYANGTSVKLLKPSTTAYTSTELSAYGIYQLSVTGTQIDSLGTKASSVDPADPALNQLAVKTVDTSKLGKQKVVTSKSGYFMVYNPATEVYDTTKYYYADDVVIYDTTNKGVAATSVAVGNYVMFTEDTDGLVDSVFIVSAPYINPLD